MTPAKEIQVYSADDWEDFINEWMEGFDPAYHFHDRLGGAGDKGRDVVGYLGDPNSNCEWDSYQCKHYDHALYPSDIWLELGKLCVYTFQKTYTPPRRYRFVAPRGVGTSLHDLLRKPNELRDGLMSEWNKKCKSSITKDKEYPLIGELKKHVENYDFSTCGYVPVNQLLRQHERTRYWHRRFKIDPPQRPDTPSPPSTPTKMEVVYLDALYAAYAEHLGVQVSCVSDLNSSPIHSKHLLRSRVRFYEAEWLNRFSRDHVEPGSFEKFKKDILDGIIDTVESEHVDGFARVLAATKIAQQLQHTSSDLKSYITTGDKHGACHHLVNDGEFGWVA